VQWARSLAAKWPTPRSVGGHEKYSPIKRRDVGSNPTGPINTTFRRRIESFAMPRPKPRVSVDRPRNHSSSLSPPSNSLTHKYRVPKMGLGYYRETLRKGIKRTQLGVRTIAVSPHLALFQRPGHHRAHSRSTLRYFVPLLVNHYTLCVCYVNTCIQMLEPGRRVCPGPRVLQKGDAAPPLRVSWPHILRRAEGALRRKRGGP
jgi:hypothetical protein